MSGLTTEDTEGTESWQTLALEVRKAMLDYWSLEHEPKSEMRLLRVVRALDAIRDRESMEGAK
jgi:hypothetical protein